MSKGRFKICRFGSLALVLAGSAPAAAQSVLPEPAAPFAGKIGETYADSVPAFPKRPVAPKGAPNVLLIMTDDVGFGAASTFGGPIPTPNLDRLATRGLIYNRFHTTAMCSPTRAALLTGRNHHAVGNGIVANLSTGFPGYDNIMPKSAATIAEVLRQNGYNTAMFGKHHNAPEADVSPAGPFDLWPTGLGFEYFYGFMAAETNQFTPALYRGTTSIPTLSEGVLDKSLADEAIHWIHDQKSAAPDKPFFVYYATGSTHAPVQAPADWIAKFSGKFDKGWDTVRAETYARQLKMGIIPRGTVNTARPEGITAWQDLSPDERRINARMMEAYAGMLAYQDDQIGRVLDELDRMGESHNTLVMFIEGDNGAAAEAGPNGSTNPMAAFANGMPEDLQSLLANLDQVGGPQTISNYGYGWAWATNAPFRLFKQYASHLGGTRNGLVVSWPDHIRDRGIRSQFTHVTDIVPTILEATGVSAPQRVNGVDQQRMDGISFTYSFDAPTAPERHERQYFEMMGNRAIYDHGWLASTTPVNKPWKRGDGSKLPTDYAWELYDLQHDFSQAHDLASREPGRLKEMQALFRNEAEKNHVYPLDDRLTLARFGAAQAQHPQHSDYTYWGAGTSIPSVNTAGLLARSFRITAQVELPEAANGAVLSLGSRFGGWSFYLKDGRPVALMAASQLAGDQSRVAAKRPLQAGMTKLVFDFAYDGGANAGGEMLIRADDREIARGRITRTISKLPEMTDTLDIGFDADTPVTDDYAPGGKFTGRIIRVDVEPGKQGMPGPVAAH
ncbi:arylsulfatase [Novosphingobium sp. PY1]|uniref:arylsulfatase n=1 Tax=Novosphingobium sp. PY1 TaxID=1882221 RepID=UPI000BE78127|nr:arylsulfatase [Novosphingobium sp. PY1]BBA74160.1 sulfatase [Novosphingobium sp. PY1]GFM31397.1 sulfatase [Novosphingobium sp. PY1]